MENVGNDSVAGAPLTADTPALAGVVGRLRLQIGGSTVGVLVIHDGHLELTADDGSVDATLVCAEAQDVVAILKGEVNPVVSVLRNRARLIGDRVFGTKVVMGLRAGSPFARLPIETSPFVVGQRGKQSGQGG
jgi:hypothetical protein